MNKQDGILLYVVYGSIFFLSSILNRIVEWTDIVEHMQTLLSCQQKIVAQKVGYVRCSIYVGKENKRIFGLIQGFYEYKIALTEYCNILAREFFPNGVCERNQNHHIFDMGKKLKRSVLTPRKVLYSAWTCMKSKNNLGS